MTTDQILPPQLVEGVIRHMNKDHAQNLLDYAHALAGLTWAEDAEMITLDHVGFDLTVRSGGRIQAVRILFEPSLSNTEQLRPALVAMAQQARQLLPELKN